jgi:hypothetical protein
MSWAKLDSKANRARTATARSVALITHEALIDSRWGCAAGGDTDSVGQADDNCLGAVSVKVCLTSSPRLLQGG